MIIVEFQHKQILYTHLHISFCENNLTVIKNQGHILLTRANPDQELKSNFSSLCKIPQMLFFHISVFPKEKHPENCRV